MKKIITMMALAILTTSAVNAQTPDFVIDYNTTCDADLEIRVFAIDRMSQTPVGGFSDWVPLTNLASGSSWYYADFSWTTGDPGTPSGTNDWVFGGIDVRNCNSASSGSTGPHCNSGNLDGVSLDGSLNNDCFMYSGNCGSCSSGAELNCSYDHAAPGYMAHALFADF